MRKTREEEEIQIKNMRRGVLEYVSSQQAAGFYVCELLLNYVDDLKRIQALEVSIEQ